MTESKVYLEEDGKTDLLDDYTIIYRRGVDTTISAKTDIYGLGKAVILVYDTFLNECARLSDQDLYEVCNIIDLSYDTIRPLVANVRKAQHG